MNTENEGAPSAQELQARLTRWAEVNGWKDRAEQIASDPRAHRDALAEWFRSHGLDPAQAQDPAVPPDPITLAQYGPLRGVAPATAQMWASNQKELPQRRMVAEYPPGSSAGPQRPHVYALADLEAWKGPQRAPVVDPAMFAEGERVTVTEFAKRTGKYRTTVSQAVTRHPDKAPAKGEDGLYDARELAAFIASLPNRRGRLPKKAD